MKLKKIIATISAAAMLITNVATSTVCTAANGTGFKSPLEDYIGELVPAGAYAVEGAENVIYHIRTNGAESSIARLRTEDASDGEVSLRIRAQDTEAKGTTLCTEFTVEFGEEIKGETYEVSFDAWREAADWRDYAAINYEGWDGKSRLTDTTKWAVETLGTGSEIGGVGSGTWKRYTASFTTDLAPQINFAVAGWGELHIDNIVVKDSSGAVVFADSFEADGPTIGVAAEPDASAFGKYLDADCIPVGDYTIEGAENVIYHVSTNGSENAFAKLRSADASDGGRSLRLRADDTEASGTTLCAGVTIEFGEAVVGESYEVSFDASREHSDWRDYAAINYEGWDGASRLSGTTKWTVTELGAGSEIGGVGDKTWSRYTATFTTDLAPQLDIAVAGWGELHIDNIVVKDSSGTVVFADSFEAEGPTIGSASAPEEPEDPEEPEPTPTPTPTPTPEKPEEPGIGIGGGSGFEFPLDEYENADSIPAGEYTVEGAENVIYRVKTNGDTNSFAKLRTADASDGTRSIRLIANDKETVGTTLCAEFTIQFGEAKPGESYEVSFDAWRESSDWRDYAALNYEGWDGASRLTGTTKWTVETLGAGKDIGGVGEGTWKRYTATFYTDYAPQVNFAVAGWGILHIDNIVVKDSSGKVVLADSFEADGPTISVEKSPFGEYEDADFIPVGDYTIEGVENVRYSVSTNGSDNAFAKLRTADASDGGRSLRLRADDTEASGTTLCAGLTIAFGEAIVGESYEVSFDACREHSDWRDYAAINYEGWDGASRLTGTTKWTVTELGVGSEIGGVGDKTWSRYTATFTTDLAPQLDIAVAGWGELHIDNIVVKNSSGAVVFADSFESDGPTFCGASEPEVQDKSPFGEYEDADFIPVGDYTIEGVENVRYSVSTNGSDNAFAKLRTADASDGGRSLRLRADDSEASGTTLCAGLTIAFGEAIVGESYEVSFDAYREHSDWRDYAAINYEGWDGGSRLSGTTKWTVTELGVGSEIGGVGDKTWSRYTATFTTDLAPQLDIAVAGWGELHIDNIVVKDSSGAVVFADSFETDGPIIGEGTQEPDEPQDGIIYDAEFKIVEKVGDSYEVVGTASNLTANTLVMSVVKVENEISAEVYTALYKDGQLVSCDVQTVSAEEGGEMKSGSILSVPALGDGEYELKAFVWDANCTPIKAAKVLGE